MQEDIAAFMDDFGVPCINTTRTTPFAGVLDMPDELHAFSGGPDAISAEYQLTYAVSGVINKRGDVISIGNITYTVRRDPEHLDDGVFAKVYLKK